MQQLLQQLTAHMTSEFGTIRREMATMEQRMTSDMATKSEIGTIRREIATMEQRMTSEIGTLITRSELDVLKSWQKQEALEQMQEQQDEQTTTLNEPVNKMYKKLMTNSK